jgi:uncharacterized phage protein gp47/JayE
MSCNCQNTTFTVDTAQFPCPCDSFVFPAPLDIGAGLSDLPRQIAGFPEFRRDMLYLVRSMDPLDAWHATKPDDMGLMLLEMWAYVCDVVSFYDKVIADELYIGTANQRPSLRKLVALLGYLPTPAVAATAKLAAMASGRLLVTVPAGTAFRSGAFNGNSPQVFELGQDTTIDPTANSWNVAPRHAGTVASAKPSGLLVKAVQTPKAGDLLLLVDLAPGGKNLGLVVSGTSTVPDGNGNNYTQIDFTTPTNLAAGKALDELRLLTPKSAANIQTEANSATRSVIRLDGLARQIMVGDPVLVSGTEDLRWYTVLGAKQSTYTAPGNAVTVNGSTFAVPGVQTPVTLLELDAPITDSTRGNSGMYTGSAPSWASPATAQLMLHYNLQSVGWITDLPETVLTSDKPLHFAGTLQPTLETPPGDFLVRDVNLDAADVTGVLDFNNGQAKLTLNPGEGWTGDMTVPVQVFGNVLDVSRGQTVTGEILGNGDASQANQAFRLQKSPLTYLPAPSATNNSGVADTLVVYVNGILWSEVASFYGQTQNDQVYIVRQNDDGDSLVIFGDGVRGQRLPTGVNNIVANYRYGAGKASPPGGAINQIAKSLKGLQSINNPLAAAGGEDAEGPDSLRTNAPKTALLLGRAVSIDDFEAAALAFPGVTTAQAEWAWAQDAQTAVVQVWYIGASTVQPNLLQRLRSLSDPTVPIEVDNATATDVNLTISVTVDPRYVPSAVWGAVTAALTDSDTGLLATGNLGIGNPLFRSQLFEQVLSVAGTVAVSGVLWGCCGFDDFAMTPGTGKYFDFTKGLTVGS